MAEIKVLIIDDSTVMQGVLAKILSTDPEIKIVGVASDPLEARELIKKTNPDILTLDIILPQMDGITFLKNLMRLHPMPVIMISSLTYKNADIALEALALGALGCMEKPAKKELENISEYAKNLISLIKKSVSTNVRSYLLHTEKIRNLPTDIEESENLIKAPILREPLIVIGASVGGVEAIETLLTRWPRIMPGIIIVQHIKKELSFAFQQRLDKLCSLTVLQADEQEEILPGYVYLAPPDVHLTVKKEQANYVCFLDYSPPINNHRPAIDILFQSVAKAAGKHAIGILLTGMGSDGAQGLKAIQAAGGATIAQDEATSVVWSMPGAAVKIGAADYVLPLTKIHSQTLSILDAKLQREK